MKKNRLYILFSLALLIELTASCAEKKQFDSPNVSDLKKIDTVYFAEEFLDEFTTKFNRDLYAKDSSLPRNLWVRLEPVFQSKDANITESSNLYLECRDSNVQIAKISNEEFKLYVPNTYEPVVIENGKEFLVLESILQPKVNFCLKTYWSGEIIYPSKTTFLWHYIPLEEVE